MAVLGAPDLDVDSDGRARYQESKAGPPLITHRTLSTEVVAKLGDAITPLLDGAVVDGPNDTLDCNYYLTLERRDHTSETTSRSLEFPCKRENRSPQTLNLTDQLDAIEKPLRC